MSMQRTTNLTEGSVSKGMLLFADNGDRCEIVTTIAEDGNPVT